MCVSRPRNAQPNHPANPNKTNSARTTAPGFSFPDGMTHIIFPSPGDLATIVLDWSLREIIMCVSNTVIKSTRERQSRSHPGHYVCSPDAKEIRFTSLGPSPRRGLHSRITNYTIFILRVLLGNETFSPPLYISWIFLPALITRKTLHTHRKRLRY